MRKAVGFIVLGIALAMPSAAQPHEQSRNARSLPMNGERPSEALMREVERRRGGALLPESHAVEESRRTIAALRAYADTGADADFREALRRARHLASWNPRGRTAYANAPEDSRSIAWALALAYDWLSPRLDTTQKNLLLSPLRVRTDDMFEDLSPRSRPTLAAIAAMLAGDVPESKSWLEKLRREVS